MMVVTCSDGPTLGGRVIWGRVGWILEVTKTSLTSEVMRLDFPVPSSPHTQMRTRAEKAYQHRPHQHTTAHHGQIDRLTD